MPESAAESALCLDDGKTHTRLHSLHPLRTPQTWKVTSARAAGEENFELGLPFTLGVWPFLGAAPAARRGFLDFCGNRLVGFLNNSTFS